MRYHKSTILVSCVFSFTLFHTKVNAAVAPTVLVRASSDAVYNGVSENGGQAIIAINAEFQLSKSWTTGVQFQDSEPAGIRQRNRSVLAYVGYDKKLSDNWLSSTYFTHREFPGGQREWEYDEFSSRLSHRSGASFGVVYAPNYYSSSVKSFGTNVRYGNKLISKTYWRAELGNINIPSLFNYQYAELTLGTRYKRLNIELGYHWTSNTILHTPVGNITSPHAVFSINYLAF